MTVKMIQIGRFSRFEALIGESAMERLKRSKVAVFGLGGVGGYAVEALARAGISGFALIDHDVIAETNINRQIIALSKTIGEFKADVMKERVLGINPDAEVNIFKSFYSPENGGMIDFSQYDYIIDAIDTVTAKLEIITRSKAAGVRVISCMGTGNKLDPSALEVADIYKTSVCPLARVMRRELKKRGIDSLKVVYSKEPPISPLDTGEASEKRSIPGSAPFVPPAAGLLIAAEVIKDLTAAVLRP